MLDTPTTMISGITPMRAMSAAVLVFRPGLTIQHVENRISRVPSDVALRQRDCVSPGSSRSSGGQRSLRAAPPRAHREVIVAGVIGTAPTSRAVSISSQPLGNRREPRAAGGHVVRRGTDPLPTHIVVLKSPCECRTHGRHRSAGVTRRSTPLQVSTGRLPRRRSRKCRLECATSRRASFSCSLWLWGIFAGNPMLPHGSSLVVMAEGDARWSAWLDRRSHYGRPSLPPRIKGHVPRTDEPAESPAIQQGCRSAPA